MKAVILADSDGAKLRPVTCTRPLAMIKLLGKPILGYTLELFLNNGFDEIVVITRYRSEDIEEYISDCDIQTVDIRCVESASQGQISCIKNVTRNWNEPFMVMNADCLCDIEMNKIMLYHKAINADLTVVCSTVEDTSAYGIINLKKNGSVESLYDRPEWNHTSSNLANTGIFVVSPGLMKNANDKQVSFMGQFLENTVEDNSRVYGYQTDCYWLCINDINDIRKASADLMSHRVNADTPESRNGIFSVSGIPEGDYNIVPPVFFGKNVRIGVNSTVGPFTVLEDNVHIGDSSRIKRSVVMKNSQICGNCDVIGSVVGEKCVFKRNTICLEGSCISDGCVIDSGSTVSNNISVWPEKKVSYRSVLRNNLRDGRNEFDLIESDTVRGNTFTEISCERCCRLGESLGSSSSGGKVAIGYNSTKESKALAMAVLSGLISSGSKISDFGECFESQMQFYVSFCSLDSGIFISADKNTAYIKFFGKYGLPLSCKSEREIESVYKKQDFIRSHSGDTEDVRDMSNISDIYYGQLLSLCGERIYNSSATVKSLNPVITDTVNRCFYLLGVRNSGAPEFNVDFSGRTVTAVDENSAFVSYEKLVILCCIDALEQGKNICLPFEAPAMIEKIASEYNKSVYRTGTAHHKEFSEETGVLARACMWAYDGLCLAFSVMGIMLRKNMSLSQLLKSVPSYNVCSKLISCNFPHSRLADVLDINLDRNSKGVRKTLKNGYLTLVRQDAGKHIRIIAEAETIEAATEICAEVQRKINIDTIDNMTQ